MNYLLRHKNKTINDVPTLVFSAGFKVVINASIPRDPFKIKEKKYEKISYFNDEAAADIFIDTEKSKLKIYQILSVQKEMICGEPLEIKRLACNGGAA